jgi:diacylglycerol kinase (ATP)
MTSPGGHGTELPVVVSTLSGAGRGRDRESGLRDLVGAQFSPRFYYPASILELRAIVSAVVVSGATHIGISGGDGTMHHAVNALGDAPVIVVPFPGGSGNDFCRGIGLEGGPQATARALRSGITRRVDLLEVNGHRVCTVAGIGIVAATGVQMAQLMAPHSAWRPLLRALGAFAYMGAAGLRLLLAPHVTANARVRWRETRSEWFEVTSEVHGLFLANLATLGAGLRLPVPGRSDDGLIELVRLPENPRVRLLRGLARLRSGRPLPEGLIDVKRAAEAEIDWPGGSALLGDGEDLGRFDRFHVRTLPGALQVVRAE